jgi:hypothetical protein
VAGAGRHFWKAMAASFLVFWVLDLSTSAVLVGSGFAYLEGNTAVRTFFVEPGAASFIAFVENQAIYIVPLVLIAMPPVLDRLDRAKSHSQFYTATTVLVLVLALDRLNSGVASNTANLIAVAMGLPLPASGDVYYLLWGLFDVGWAASVVFYIRLKIHGSTKP